MQDTQVDKLTYQALVYYRLNKLSDVYSSLVDLVKYKKDDLSSELILLLEDSFLSIVEKNKLDVKELDQYKAKAFYTELSSNLIKESITHIEKFVKLLESSLANKQKVVEIHKVYYNKLKCDCSTLLTELYKINDKDEVSTKQKNLLKSIDPSYSQLFDDFTKISSQFTDDKIKLKVRILFSIYKYYVANDTLSLTSNMKIIESEIKKVKESLDSLTLDLFSELENEILILEKIFPSD